VAQAGAAAEEPAAADADAGAAPDEEEEFEPEPEGAAIAPPSDVEVIRIKGRAVTAIETDVPESVTQFDAATIEALGAQNISDLAKVTPNVEIRVAGATAPTFFIRGVGLSDFNANAAGAVSVYQDDIAINAPALQIGQLFDVENVEVLRGPQGGGSGRNASAGAIKVYSRKPTGELAAELRSSLGRYNSRDFEGALEVPLVEETLATRLAFRLFERDPYATNGCGDAQPMDERPVTGLFPNPDPPPAFVRVRPADVSICGERFGIKFNGDTSPIREGLPTEVNDAGNWAARGQLRFQPPGTDMDWILNAHGSRLDQLSTLGQAMGTNGTLGFRTGGLYQEPDNQEMSLAIDQELREQNPDLTQQEITELKKEILADELARNLDIRPFRGDYNRVGQTRLDAWGVFLRGDASFGPVDFTSISGYETYDRYREEDQDFTPDVLFEAVSEDDAWQFSQELRLGGELADVPFRWEAGGYYLMERLHAEVDQFIQENALRPFRKYDQDMYSFAFFAGFGWDFLDDFTLDGGIRYNWERKDFDFTLVKPNFLVPDPDDPDNPAARRPQTRRTVTNETWQAPTGTIRLLYRFGDDASVYWKYSRGWKGGHFNASAQFAKDVEAVDPETIDAFEAGLRGRWLDGRLGLGAAVFYYTYTDYQVFVVEDEPGAPPTLAIVNANDAEVYGAEVELRAEPLDGLVLTGRFGWLENQFLDFTQEVFRSVVRDFGPPPIVEALPVQIDYSGNRLLNSPRFTASLAAEWTIDLGRWGALIPRYDFAWTDDIFFDPAEGRGSPDELGETVLPEYTAGQRAFWLHNARLAYRTPEGNIEVAGWVRNLTDQAYKKFAFDASTFSDLVVNFVGLPRTYGVSLSISW
jgi:iron complex outermembrane receptor protein